MADIDWMQRVKKREEKMGDLTARMDTDWGLYNLTDYVWKDSKGNEVKNVDNVTLSDPRAFGDRVKDTMVRADQQIIIDDGQEKVKDAKATPIENLLRVILEAADDRLCEAGLLPLRDALSGQLCIRGRGAVRCVLHIQDGEFTPDIRWYDTRFLSYATGFGGLKWVAPRSTRSAEDIEAEYGYDLGGKDEAEVVDIWTPDDEFVYINNKLIKTNPHGLGYVPWIIELCPTGGFLLDKGFLQYTGDSIYAPVRKLYAILNRLVTIMATTARYAMEGAYQYESAAGERADVGDEYPVEPGKVTAVEPGGGYKLIPINDIKRATELCVQIIETRILRATLSYIEYGVDQGGPHSGSGMALMAAANDAIYSPRFFAKDRLYTRLCKMILLQYSEGGIEAELGEGPHKMTYKQKDLEGEYSLKVKHVPNLPEKELANFARAQAASPWVSGDTIRREFLELRDPDGEEKRLLAEWAENQNPALRLRKAVQGMIQEGEDDAAKIILQQLGVTLDQLMTGNIMPTQGDGMPKANPGAMLPAFASQGGQANAARQRAMQPGGGE